MTSRPFSLYVHVPFCAHKCPYCDFNTYATPSVPEQQYVSALISELQGYVHDERFAGRAVTSIFFGGGTPSLLSPGALGRILDFVATHFAVDTDAEVTLEANPSRPELARFQEFHRMGINRISFGVQSFNPVFLTALGRDHSPEDARRSVEHAVQAGIENVSVDIIYGVPDQTVEHVREDLLVACSLPIRHISTYALSIEPGTPFFQRQERGLLRPADDEVVAAMMDLVPAVLGKHGFERYEISNYALPGHESRHNTVYWCGGDYLGIGAGAHSYCATYADGGLKCAQRWSTLANPQSYMAAAAKDGCVSWRESLGASALAFEFFYLGLRRLCGVSGADFRARFGVSWDQRFLPVLLELKAEGFVSVSEDAVCLTGEGIKLSDSVFERLAVLEDKTPV